MVDEMAEMGNMHVWVWDGFEEVTSSRCWYEALGAFYSIGPRVSN